ncbi:MAG: protein kinase [Gemmatimonadota bacterium]|nr:protein kinase [Gemmatimonadota bacterium]
MPRELAELGGEIEVLRELGRGGMGVVYLARQVATGREVAIKVIRARFVEDEEALARFAREARVLAGLRHPRIIGVESVKQLLDGSVALIMERVAGRTLTQAIRRDGAFAFDRAERVLLDVAEALGHAHGQGVVHRDVKPENIFLEDAGGRALLADFGIARSIEADSSLTMTGVAIGTPTYMSPEQIDGAQVDGRSDLYSLGVVAWEMLSGTRPWDGESLYSVIYRQKHEDLPALDLLRPDIPAALFGAIEGLLEKDREERWPDAASFIAALSSPARPRRRRAATVPPPTETQRLVRSRTAPAEIEAAAISPEEQLVDEVDLFAPGGWTRRRRRGALIASVVIAALGSAAILFARSEGERSTPNSANGRPVGAVGLANRPPAATPHAPASPESLRVSTGVIATAAARNPGADAARVIPLPAPATTVRPSPSSTPAPSVGGSGTVATSLSPPAPERMRIVTGGVHSCALASDGRAWCWGGNASGQLGIGAAGRSMTPIPLVGDVRFSSLSPGLLHSCGISRGSVAYCWGENEHGQVGDGTNTSRFAPVRVAGGNVFRALASGAAHTCGITADGVTLCWGADSRGQLGDGGATDRSTPAVVGASERFVALASGWNHSCALDTIGRAWCWGANSAGQIGDGSVVDQRKPTAVAGDLRFVALAAGNEHSCGITGSGAAYCWGRNQFGQLGDGGAADHSTSVRVRTRERLRAIAAGGVHSCAVTDAGAALCWGRNTYGQLGDGGTSDRSYPAEVAGGHSFASIRAFGSHSCGTTLSGENFCWGYNLDGQLGDGTRAHRARPTYVEQPAR